MTKFKKTISLLLCILLGYLGLLPLAKCNCPDEVAKTALVHHNAGDCLNSEPTTHCSSCCPSNHKHDHKHSAPKNQSSNSVCEIFYQLSHNYANDIIDFEVQELSLVAIIDFDDIKSITVRSFKKLDFNHNFHTSSGKHTLSLFSQNTSIIC